MSPIPSITQNITDPGLGLTQPLSNAPVLIGISELGTPNEFYSITSPQSALDQLGQGRLSEDAARLVLEVGGPVYAIPATISVAASASAVTKVGSGPTVSITFDGYESYRAQVAIVKSGALGVGTFQVTLDNGKSFTAPLKIPSGGTYTIANAHIVITFAAGSYVAETVYSFTTTAPFYGATDVTNAMTTAKNNSKTYPFIVLCGEAPTVSAAETIFAAFSSQLEGHAAVYKYVRGMMDFGSADSSSNVLAGRDTVQSRRVMPCYGNHEFASAKPFAGFSVVHGSNVSSFALRAFQSLPSTNLARVASGSLTGVISTDYNEFTDAVGLADAGIATLRNWVGQPGIYPTTAPLASPPGSDFKAWQYGRLMDIACSVTYLATLSYVNAGIRVKADGTIDDRDAARIETSVNKALSAALLQPVNAEGTGGYVSFAKYTVDRTNTILTTSTLQGTVAIQPLAYAEFITTNLGFVSEVIPA